jgi:hypothetical protein
MDEDLYDLLWRYSEKSTVMDNFPILADLTEKLIHVYEEQGRLASNPFIPIKLYKAVYNFILRYGRTGHQNDTRKSIHT